MMISMHLNSIVKVEYACPGWSGLPRLLEDKVGVLCLDYSEVPNRRADQNKRAGSEESDALLAYLLSKLINEQGGIFHLLHENASRVERKSEKSKQACSSIRNFRVLSKA